MPPGSSLSALRVRKRRVVLVWPFEQRRQRKVDSDAHGSGDQGMSQDVMAGSTHDYDATDQADQTDRTGQTDHGRAAVDVLVAHHTPSPPPPLFASAIHLPPSLDMSASHVPAVEPADPQVREAEGLPPKSYAAAAEEAIHTPAPADSPDSKSLRLRDAHGTKGSGGTYGSYDANGIRHGKKKNVENINTNAVPISPPASSDNEYEGQGLDNSPKSPARGHKRKVSLKANGSLGRSAGEKASHDVFEDYQGASGKPLTSVKPPADLENRTVDQSRQPRERNALTAGRKAGAGWQQSKIRWAPLNVPIQRRLQTLAVLMHTLSIAGGLTIFFFLCSIPLLWPILLPYLVYVLFSNAGVSGELYWRSEYWRNSKVWSLFASYFPARLHRSQELEPTRKYIFGYHPHGIISHGAFAAFATEALGFGQLFPGITNTLLTLDSNFHIPLYREYALRMGLGSVSGESIRNILSKGGRNREGMGRAVTIVIGGARESLESKPGSFRLVLNRRKGFVKMAIRTGADLVPVLAFGENEIYDQVDAKSHPYIHKLQLLVKKVMGFTVPLFHARGIFNYDVGMMPYRRPLNIVTGRPIRIVQEDHPDNHTIDEIHKQYVDELMRIWDDWKDTFAQDRKSELELIE